MNDTNTTTLADLREAMLVAMQRGATAIDDVPVPLLGQLLDLLYASHQAAELLENGRAKAARQALNRVLNQIPER